LGTPQGAGFSFMPTPVATAGEIHTFGEVAAGPDGVTQVLYIRSVLVAGSYVGQLFYAKRSGAGFAAQQLSVTGENVQSPAIALAVDAQNAPHVLYYEYASNQLRSTQLQGTTWTTTVVGTGFGPAFGAYEPELQLTAQGEPRFAWHDSGRLSYAWLESGVVRSIPLAPQCRLAAFDMKLGADGLPRFTCGALRNGLDEISFVEPRMRW
ncbi:MAG: hypothetical protein JNG84_13325, partial [Archangium sp.]|nr:hypothetical protein [Archangium sp.]